MRGGCDTARREFDASGGDCHGCVDLRWGATKPGSFATLRMTDVADREDGGRAQVVVDYIVG